MDQTPAAQRKVHRSQASGADHEAGKIIMSGSMVWISMGADCYSVAEIVLLMKIEGVAHIHCKVRHYKQVGQAWVRQELMHRIPSCLVVDAAIWAECTGGRRVLLPPGLQYFQN